MGHSWVSWQEPRKWTTPIHTVPCPSTSTSLCAPSLCQVCESCPVPLPAEFCALTPGCPRPMSITHLSPLCSFGQRYHKMPLHPLPYVKADLHQGREDQGQHGHGETQHIEKGDSSKGLLCIQDVVLIHQYIDGKACQGDLGQTAGKATISMVVCNPDLCAPLRPQQCLPAGDLFPSCLPSPLGPISPL